MRSSPASVTAREPSRCRGRSPERSSARSFSGRSAGEAGCCSSLTFVSASVVIAPRAAAQDAARHRRGARGTTGAGNAIANTGVAALCALLALLTPSADAARLAFVAALAAAGSDTIASEIGKAWGRRTWSITSLKHVPPGTSGAMSIEGTAAGVVGALALGLAGSLLHLVPESAIMIVAVAPWRAACSRAGWGRRSKARACSTTTC